MADHLDDRRHAAAGLANHLRPGAEQLDLRGGVRAVAELVLQTLDVHRVARPVGQDARHQKAGQTLGGAIGRLGLGEHEEDVGHRRRAEPLVASELILGSGSATVERPGVGRVRAHVRAALLLGHRHAGDRRALLGGGDRAGVIRRGGHQRLPLRCQLRLGAQRGDHREGHRDRARVPSLGLHPGHVHRRAGGVRRGLLERQGRECSSCSTPIVISWCQAGWNSTSSRRLP